MIRSRGFHLRKRRRRRPSTADWLSAANAPNGRGTCGGAAQPRPIGFAIFILFFLLAMPMTAPADIERRGDAIILSGKTYTMAFSSANRSILSIGQAGKTGTTMKSGEQGLWHVRLRDGSQINSADFGAASRSASG